jgi:lipopolysaccharide/colanic/teichoic acid biosynthesis glycosyltransferase
MTSKRVLDAALASIGLVVSSPLVLLCALIVRTTMGRPVLFRQERLGYLGQPFILLKFRTLRDARDEQGTPLPDAERLPRVGRVLRRTSLDELPELVNVLRGEMSLVGPRPLLPEYRAGYTKEQWRRHDVPPGIAGPVPAYGRNALSWPEKLTLDVWYVDNRSAGLDLKLLILTVWNAVVGQGVSAPGHATMPPFEGSTRRTEGEQP